MILGRKYKVDRNKLSDYNKKFWNMNEYVLDFVTPILKYKCIANTYWDKKNIKCYTILENRRYYPEDCLIDMIKLRKKKLERILK